jgi:hypothetical protein
VASPGVQAIIPEIPGSHNLRKNDIRGCGSREQVILQKWVKTKSMERQVLHCSPVIFQGTREDAREDAGRTSP